VIAPARDAAFRALRAMASLRVDLGEALSRARDPLNDIRDRALATDLATGTLRWRGAIDYQLQRFSAKPLHRLDEAVLDALRLGAYQILYLDRVPVSAVVNDAVAIVGASGFRSATGFTNAVLRRLVRERTTLSWPQRPSTLSEERRALIDYFAIVHSHPAWLVERWLNRYGAETAEAWLQFNNQPPSITVAANRLRATRDEVATRLRGEGIETSPTPMAPHGLVVNAGRVLTSAAFHDGLCLVQDEASQIIPELVPVAAGALVLDACASPGGKTVALAARCTINGTVVATDVRARRIRLLAETMHRCRPPNVRIVHVSDEGTLPFPDATFDSILIDAPCSGLGTLRRDPDIRWRRQPADFPALAAVQSDLLRRLAPLVAAGGHLVYSTCSSEPEENEAVVAAFLTGATSFGVIPLASLSHLSEEIKSMATPEGYLRTTPAHGLEAFFGAVLRQVGR
jgi:16S rRNA (cytosine967-C5)-methyltransferase